jgi:hypothetical protein
MKKLLGFLEDVLSFIFFILEEPACWFILFIISILSGFVFLLYYANAEAKRWTQFKVDHHCKIVGRMSGDATLVTTIGANGKPGIGVTSTPSKVGYLCDDSVTYWR